MTAPQIGWVTIRVEIQGEPSFLREVPLTREDLNMPQDILKSLLGDEKARVTCSAELKSSDFGRGYGCFVSVSLTCDQSEDGVQAAGEQAIVLSRQLCEVNHSFARSLFEEVVPPSSSKDGRR